MQWENEELEDLREDFEALAEKYSEFMSYIEFCEAIGEMAQTAKEEWGEQYNDYNPRGKKDE